MRAVAALAPFPDWRRAADYRFLLGAGATAFAWEWLRRDPDYRLMAASSVGQAATWWGLHDYIDPELDARIARPIWREDSGCAVLAARATGSSAGADAIDLAAAGTLFHMHRGTDRTHVLLSDGVHSIRLDVVGLLEGPMLLRFELCGFRTLRRHLRLLEQLLAFRRLGHFSSSLHVPLARAPRHILLLRTADALRCGASQREIAAHLLDRAVASPCWRVEASSIRSQVQRLVRDARVKQGGAWRRLLSI